MSVNSLVPNRILSTASTPIIMLGVRVGVGVGVWVAGRGVKATKRDVGAVVVVDARVRGRVHVCM